jgi:peroxidase
LANINPKWKDDRLFYEARRILVAFLQHIVYSEFVPSIIGFGSSKITPLTEGYFYEYNPNVKYSFNQ